MKVNITSNNSLIRPIPGTKYVTPVYGKDIQDSTLIRLLNFPALRVYEAASGIIVTKKNVNSLLNIKDHAVDAVKEVVPSIKEDKPIDHKHASKKSKKVETSVEEPVKVEEKEVIETPVIEVPVEEVKEEVSSEPVVETVEEEIVTTAATDTNENESTVNESPIVSVNETESNESAVKPQQSYNKNRNRNKNKH